MISRLLTGLVVLIPAAVLAADGDPLPADPALLETSSLKASSLEDLCSLREREDVLAEIERRDVFSKRELRAIRNGEIQQGISVEALTCVKGSPTIVVDAAEQVHLRPVAAYIHLIDGSAGSLSYIFEQAGESTVVYSLESADPAAIVRNPSLRLLCGRNRGTPSRCQLVDDTDDLGTRVYADVGARCDERLCDAVNAFPDVAALPPVRDDAQ